MLLFHVLDLVLGQQSKVRLLRFLLRVGGQHTGRSLARGVGLSPKTCTQALDDLVRLGIVERRVVGRAYLFRLQDDAVLIRDVLGPLFRAEAGLLERYLAELLELLSPEPESLVLYGSLARGEGELGSDADLLAVASSRQAAARLEESAAEAGPEMVERFGVFPQVVVVERRQLRERLTEGDPFLEEVRRSGRLVHGRALPKEVKRGA